jgi:hypothetical protein
MDYEKYEAECEKIRLENENYLLLFHEDMLKSNLSIKTINKHLGNVDFYINEYLLRYDAEEMPKGCQMINEFLGDYFIRRCMWSTPTSIKSTATSIKKFYKCMLSDGKIEKRLYDNLCFDIKVGMDDWIDICARYNDFEGENPFEFFY